MEGEAWELEVMLGEGDSDGDVDELPVAECDKDALPDDEGDVEVLPDKEGDGSDDGDAPELTEALGLLLPEVEALPLML